MQLDTDKNALLKQIAASASQATSATEVRNQAIVGARSLGVTLREIAKAAGLTHQGVAKILKKSSATDLTSVE